MINLLTNAIHAIEQAAKPPNEGLLSVHTSDSEDRVGITIQDNGVGLGMPVAMQVIEQHGGSMNFKSEPGKGTLFIVYLPSIPVEAPI
jgi:signal transduction histidine kinase